MANSFWYHTTNIVPRNRAGRAVILSMYGETNPIRANALEFVLESNSLDRADIPIKGIFRLKRFRSQKYVGMLHLIDKPCSGTTCQANLRIE